MSVAFVFPGQGSQTVGMGRDLIAVSPAAAAVFAEADAILGLPLSQLCFDGPEEQLTATKNAQPALLTVSIALLAALAGDVAAIPAFVAEHAIGTAGHSLGEYSALVAAGALDFPTALRLVRQRGELMAQASEGAMAAIIGLDEAPLEALCKTIAAEYGPLVIANYNSPGQLVISGTAASIEQAISLAKANGAKRAIPLKVSAAFHSPLMQAAADRLAPAIAAAEIDDPRVPVFGNVNAEPLRTAAALREELIKQITAPVRWIASVQAMAETGVETVVEIGSGNVLTNLVKRIVPEVSLVNINSAAQLDAWSGR